MSYLSIFASTVIQPFLYTEAGSVVGKSILLNPKSVGNPMSDETHDIGAEPRASWRFKWAALALLSGGLVCLLGPGRFLPKQAEGPILYVLTEDHGITALDLVGVALLIGALYALRRHRLG